MKVKALKLLTSVLVLNLLVTFTALSQGIDSTISAKVTLIQKEISGNKKKVALISVTFVNLSDQDIYIPAILNKGKQPVGGRVKVYKKVGTKYISDGFVGKPIPDNREKKSGVFVNTISGSRNEILDKYIISETKKDKMQSDILQEYEKTAKDATDKVPISDLKPLFLKAHEEYEIYFIKDVDYIINIPNDYMVEYDFEYVLTNINQYPDHILSYQKFFPNKIASNKLYLRVEP